MKQKLQKFILLGIIFSITFGSCNESNGYIEKIHQEQQEKERKEKAKKEAEEKAKKEAEEKAKKEAEEKAKKEAEEKAKKEAEEKAKKEAEEKAKQETEEKAKKEAEEKAKKEAEEKAKQEAEEKAKQEAEEKAKKEAEEKAKKEAEEKAKQEAEEKAKQEAEEKAKQEAEEKAKQEAEERERREREEQERREREERERREREEQERREREERERREREEQERREREEQERREREEQERREREEQERREREEREKQNNPESLFLREFEQLENPEKKTWVTMKLTGQKCPACGPTIPKLIELKSENKENLVVVFMHSPYHLNGNLFTREAQEYLNHSTREGQRISGFPYNLFNSLGSYKETRGLFDVIKEQAFIKRMAKVKRDNRNLEIMFTAKAINGNENTFRNKRLKLVIWVLENKINAFQYMGRRLESNFEHNYVFRSRLTDMLGDEFRFNEVYKKTVELPSIIKDNKIADSELVFMIIDSETGQIYDALEFQLK